MAQLHRLEPLHPRTPVHIEVDGEAVVAYVGDTVLTAVLSHRRYLRGPECGDGACAGFCLMGACQDCWVWLGADLRARACTTLVAEGMKVYAARPA